jgi:DinB family protein
MNTTSLRAPTSAEWASIDYTQLALPDIRAGLEDVAQRAQTTFGALDERQLNWRPDATGWSVAQCFDHLLTADRLMVRAVQDALNQVQSRTVWQRLPIWPRVIGRLLIRSQTPGATRKFTASPLATPTASDIHSDVMQRFIDARRDVGALIQPLDERLADRTIMTSPFIKIITYSVLDGYRLMLAHDRRHFEQARRVMLSRGFPTIKPTDV